MEKLLCAPLSFEGFSGGSNPQRIEKIKDIWQRLTVEEKKKFRIEECTDERTGQRYGKANKRVGRCEKIGSGGRNKGSTYSYQIWAVWN